MSSPEPKPSSQRGISPSTLLVLIIVLAVLGVYLSNWGGQEQEISYDQFRWLLGQRYQGQPVVQWVRFRGQEVQGQLRTAVRLPGEKAILKSRFRVVLPPTALSNPDLERQLLKQNIRILAQPARSSGWWNVLVLFLIGAGVFLLMLFLLQRAQGPLGGGFLANFGKSPARRYEAKGHRVTFDDVAGLEGVKQDLQEVVQFLKNPQKFRRMGARVPKGTLLIGPPGTGKTLLARAVAGEAGVPFFSINGSEFIQMFVGVGASRVRDLFQTAKENAPCILFIDEIDAVGRVRGAGLGGGHDEREQTLNQILSEMDGFTPHEEVIVLAATNRPDILDPALLRPGRFDRHITVDRPNYQGRLQLFRVHSREVPLAEDVDFERLARRTVGLTGADIRNIVNEAALWATRQGKEVVCMADFDYAMDKVLMGPKRDEVPNEKEKHMTAYHEAGHALLAWLLPEVDPVHKVTIIPRGRALGVTQLLPEEDRMCVSQSTLEAQLVFIFGGRAAELLVFDELTSGAENDLERATALARRMVTAWGMSSRLGPVSYRTSHEHPFLGKEIYEHREFSDQTARLIDEEVARILNHADERARELLQQHRDKLDRLAQALLERELLDSHEIEELIGPPARASAQSPTAQPLAPRQPSKRKEA